LRVRKKISSLRLPEYESAKPEPVRGVLVDKTPETMAAV
jgi:hypothetical protein